MKTKIRSEYRSNGTRMTEIRAASAETLPCKIKKNNVTAAKQTASASAAMLQCEAELLKYCNALRLLRYWTGMTIGKQMMHD